ncbi:MAG: flavin reductase family protein [Bacteroidetes bacterium]|jgi:flavin reductase (DIM6/NTAB) family NADH-FMN oxidoreductase RutF|nr:flavin reductase family protein [Bacteroidota bacterium]
MMTINPETFDQRKLHRLMLGSIAPRPIAFASTIDKAGNPNLSPFSFFNAFGVNPTTLIFSPSRRGRDNTTKDTFENLKEVPEVVINVVSFKMVQQMSLASSEYPKGVNEFKKSGLTALASETIRPFRVKESPVQFECTVRQIIETGDGPGAGNLIICEIKRMHIMEDVLDDQGEIDINKIDLVGRHGGDYYVRTSGDANFIVPKPLAKPGIGIDALPQKIKHHKLLSGNDLGRLGNLSSLPLAEQLDELNPEDRQAFSEEKHISAAKALLQNNQPEKALAYLMKWL